MGDYYLSSVSERDICFVTGKETAKAQLHPAGIRAQETEQNLSLVMIQNFTFRGRFESASQAANVGLEVTQKAHHMLAWLVQIKGSLVSHWPLLLGHKQVLKFLIRFTAHPPLLAPI